MLRERSLVLVAGSGRSGTSLASGILQRLGCHVPAPEVPADETNPRGFSESQWVVEFHASLLRRAGVQAADARPAAWALTAELCLDEEVRGELRLWLERQFGLASSLVIKDPRLSWFLPLWRRCAESQGVAPRVLTMLRHPAAVIDSKQRWYGGRQGDVSRTAGWVNQTLFTERATRDAPRIVVRYEDLLDDWTRVIGRVGEALDLAVVRDAPAASLRTVHEFVDRSLSRSRPDWGDLALPARLRAQADEAWELMSALADGEGDTGRLDAVRAAYVALYDESEGIAQSSIEAARRRGAPATGLPVPAARLARHVPARYRRRIPRHWRRRIVRAFATR
jgi:hypothetical protein